MKLTGRKEIVYAGILIKNILIVLFAAGTFFSCSSKSVPALLTMVKVDGGSFLMGNDEGKAMEQPGHQVHLSGFYMSAHEVTQGQWALVMGTPANANAGEGAELPVYNVSWNDAVDFCNALSEREKLDPCYTGSGTSERSANVYTRHFGAPRSDSSSGFRVVRSDS